MTKRPSHWPGAAGSSRANRSASAPQRRARDAPGAGAAVVAGHARAPATLVGSACRRAARPAGARPACRPRRRRPRRRPPASPDGRVIVLYASQASASADRRQQQRPAPGIRPGLGRAPANPAARGRRRVDDLHAGRERRRRLAVRLELRRPRSKCRRWRRRRAGSGRWSAAPGWRGCAGRGRC